MVKVGKSWMEVDTNVFHVLDTGAMNEINQKKRLNNHGVTSLDALIESFQETEDVEDLFETVPSIDDALIDEYRDMVQDKMLRFLHYAISLLDSDDQQLINALFFDGKQLKELAAITGRSSCCLEYRKKRALKRLRSSICMLCPEAGDIYGK